MKVKSIGANKTIVSFGDCEILVSYETPVAGYTDKLGYFKTNEFHSITTSKHIGQYLPDRVSLLIIPQVRLNRLLDGLNISELMSK